MGAAEVADVAAAEGAEVAAAVERAPAATEGLDMTAAGAAAVKAVPAAASTASVRIGGYKRRHSEGGGGSESDEGSVEHEGLSFRCFLRVFFGCVFHIERFAHPADVTATARQQHAGSAN
jgi:hypothetical protein